MQLLSLPAQLEGVDMINKFILDACCGPKGMWVNKNHPNTVYIDHRREEQGFCKNRPNVVISPDIVMDFRKMDFPDKRFKLVVWDPPHLKSMGHNAQMRQQYGGLDPETWQRDLKLGFNECWRVLEDYGVLIFKWNDNEIGYLEVCKVIKKKPLFQGTMGRKNSTTYWACFMKIPGGKA